MISDNIDVPQALTKKIEFFLNLLTISFISY